MLPLSIESNPAAQSQYSYRNTSLLFLLTLSAIALLHPIIFSQEVSSSGNNNEASLSIRDVEVKNQFHNNNDGELFVDYDSKLSSKNQNGSDFVSDGNVNNSSQQSHEDTPSSNGYQKDIISSSSSLSNFKDGSLKFQLVPLSSINVKELQSKLDIAIDRMNEMLSLEYGEYASVLFDKYDILMGITPVSRTRLENRILMKILSIHPEDKVFRWMTAGHSAAAGHGNLYDQSYTHSIASTASDIFSSVGLSFSSENFAMGGQSSAPELCFCMKEIYGIDMDILSWDFGMTDGRDYLKLKCWGSRASMLPNRPILAIIDGMQQRYKTMKAFEDEAGMGVFQMDSGQLSKVLVESIPDALKDEKAKDLKPALKDMVCGGKVEESDICSLHKFDISRSCLNARVKGQTSWHPGWKAHLLTGRMLGYFIVMVLSDVVKRLSTITEEELNTIQEIMNVEYLLRNNTAYAGAKNLREHKNSNYDNTALQIMESAFISKSNTCRTSIRPSKARYDGIMSGDRSNGSFRGGFWQGTLSTEALSRPSLSPGESIPLVYNPAERGLCTNNTEIDFIDVYLVRGSDDWLTVQFPNALEVEAYGDVPTESFIHICTLVCPWGKCPKNEVHLGNLLPLKNETTNEILSKPTVEMKINDIPVTNINKSSAYCYFMEHDNGWTWNANDYHQYEIKVRVVNSPPSMILRLTSFAAFSTY